jgi:molecular chaperone GrpE (heat shock protein)
VCGSCFELYTATTALYITQAIFAPSTRKDLLDVYRTKGISAVQKELTQITTSTAQASQPADETAIKEIINQLPEGFTTLDAIVRDKLSTLVMATLANEEGTTEEQSLCQELQEANSELQSEVGEMQEEIEELKRQVALLKSSGCASRGNRFC